MATSASLRTTNYELRKYASMDEVKVLQDFNVNMDLIDGAIHTVAETLDVTAGVVSDNVTRLDGLDDSVVALQTAVNTANTTANSALSASGTANAGVADVVADINSIEGNLTRNLLNNNKNLKQLKMDYGTGLLSFSNGVCVLALPQTYTSAECIAIVVNGIISNTVVNGNLCEITAFGITGNTQLSSVILNGQYYVKWHVIGY